MHNHQIDYSRYFPLKQKVFLINVSETRDTGQYESMSGHVAARRGDFLEVTTPYPVEQELNIPAGRDITYKLTSEVMGNGIQVVADLIRVVKEHSVHLRLRGVLEMFQRRTSPRIDATIDMFHLQRDCSLTFCRKEWKRVLEYMDVRGLPPSVALRPASINLSVGGLRVVLPEQQQISPLSMFFLDIKDGKQPVCSLGELVWHRIDHGEMPCGYRFIQIRKSDRERINDYICAVQKEQGISIRQARTNWELTDQMQLPAQKQDNQP
jgi:c-di-GMP-binding flagellar brake protein YcgR